MAFGFRPVEGLVTVVRPFGGIFSGRRVLVTGHTGFKGAWLTRWLLDMGADVSGYALEPDTSPALYTDLGLAGRSRSHIGDIRDFEQVARVVSESRPEIVIHMAAQPLVRRSYSEPAYTFDVNVMGTANLLEAVRRCEDTRVVVNVTTDKVYANNESGEPFTEDQPLGGLDPYSASKAASEIVTASYRSSFFNRPESASVATARAGNVIGGGDWAEDRLVPDCARALSGHERLTVRNPASVRPWQHVLEPLSGYLRLAEALWDRRVEPSAFNFGPCPQDARTVGELADGFIAEWGTGSWHAPDLGEQPHEAASLRLSIDKAEAVLGWQPVWSFEQTVAHTAAWYRSYSAGKSAVELVEGDLEAYIAAATTSGVSWMNQGEARRD